MCIAHIEPSHIQPSWSAYCCDMRLTLSGFPRRTGWMRRQFLRPATLQTKRTAAVSGRNVASELKIHQNSSAIASVLVPMVWHRELQRIDDVDVPRSNFDARAIPEHDASRRSRFTVDDPMHSRSGSDPDPILKSWSWLGQRTCVDFIEDYGTSWACKGLDLHLQNKRVSLMQRERERGREGEGEKRCWICVWPVWLLGRSHVREQMNWDKLQQPCGTVII